MKFLAMEKEIPDIKPEQFVQYLVLEAKTVWDLYQEGIIRELYFRQDHTEAVLILESSSIDEANRTLNKLPLVQAGLISFEIIPLIPYTGFSRLFVKI